MVCFDVFLEFELEAQTKTKNKIWRFLMLNPKLFFNWGKNVYWKMRHTQVSQNFRIDIGIMIERENHKHTKINLVWLGSLCPEQKALSNYIFAILNSIL